MPTNKDFKRHIRARMAKTGESYTAARAQLLRKRSTDAPIPAFAPVPAPAPALPDYARLAGISDAVVKARTGDTWEGWVLALDRVNAHEWPHRMIAEHLAGSHQVPDWWAQMVTVGYERIKGLRQKGQRRGGAYEASRSKTVPVSIDRLYRAWSSKATRARWLPGIDLTIRTASRNRSMRISWPDGTSVQPWFTAKGPAKSSVQVQHVKLPDQAAVERTKGYWGERLEALAGLLTAEKPARR